MTDQAVPDPRVASITGGGSGIGLAFAELWVAQGGIAVLLDRDEAALDAARSLLGHCARTVRTDVMDAASVDAAYASVKATEGRLDVVVNCAGTTSPAPSHLVSDADWNALLDIHLGGTMRSCRSAYPLLLASPSAAVVNISSVAARTGMPRRASYSAAKAAIEAMSRTLAVEWAVNGIRVNSVAPGYTRTPLNDKQVAAGSLSLDSLVRRIPLGRLAHSGEIAQAINFMASPAASFVTGQCLVVDGGMTVEGDWYK